MRRKIFSALFVLCVTVFSAGCGIIGGLSYEMTARDRAQRYVTEKYGFTADAERVILTENSWLEFTWEAPQSAHVLMKHGGREFTVLVPIREDDPEFICDNYEAEEICAEIRGYAESCLECDEIAVRADYGNPYGNHLLPKDIRSAGELKRSERDKIITVFAKGLDPASAENLDPSEYGTDTHFSIVEMRDGDLPEIPYGLIRELPAQCGWSVAAVHYTDNDGSWKHVAYDRTVLDNVCLVMPSECHAEIERAEGPGMPDDDPVTEWYRIRYHGEGYGALYADADMEQDEEFCIEYEHNGQAYYERMPHTGGDDPEYGLCSNRWGSSGSEFVFRVVRRDYRRNYE